MAVIQIKRGNKADLPVTAAPGEPIATLDTKELYLGGSDNSVNPLQIESDNITDKDIASGVAALDADKYSLYNIKTDELYFSAVTEVTLQNSEDAIINSLPISEFRLVKWLVNVADQTTGDFYSSEILAHHNGTVADFAEYASIGTETVSFTAVVEAANLNLRGVSTKNNQVVRLITTAIRFT